jgi:hypothetical protein
MGAIPEIGVASSDEPGWGHLGEVANRELEKNSTNRVATEDGLRFLLSEP